MLFSCRYSVIKFIGEIVSDLLIWMDANVQPMCASKILQLQLHGVHLHHAGAQFVTHVSNVFHAQPADQQTDQPEPKNQ